MSEWFHRLADRSAEALGKPVAFALALAGILIWLGSGPVFGYSDTWQLVVNTTTTIVTFLMVFLIQNTQNREAKATRLKLDELIRATASARNALLELDELSDEELERLRKEFGLLAARYREQARKRRKAPLEGQRVSRDG